MFEMGDRCIKVTLITGAEFVLKSLSHKDLYNPTECTFWGHISWIRQMMDRRIIHSAQWRNTRDMTADGRIKSSIERDVLAQVAAGTQPFKHELNTDTPHRAPTSKVEPGSR
eukprot:7834754-Pyramimonas_sp.AAC.1